MAPKNQAEQVKKLLKTYTQEQILFTDHALIRMKQRQITKKQVLQDIMNTDQLLYAETQKAEKPQEKKYNCYFEHTKNLCHRYVLILKEDIVVVTVVKIQRRWQAQAEKTFAKKQ